MNFNRSVIYNASKLTRRSLEYGSNPEITCFLSCNVQTRISRSENYAAERDIEKLASEVRKFGRLSYKDVISAFNIIKAKRTTSVTNSLIMIRCCGGLLIEEPWEKRTQILESLGVNLDIGFYSALLRICLENEYDFKSNDVLINPEEQGLEPDRVTYQRLITRYCQKCGISGAAQIPELMREKAMPINATVFDALVKGHSRSNNMVGAESISNVTKQANIIGSIAQYRYENDVDPDGSSLERLLETTEANNGPAAGLQKPLYFVYAFNKHQKKLLKLNNMQQFTSKRNYSSGNQNIINPKFDGAFKKIFGDPRNKSTTKFFIEHCTGIVAVDLEFINPRLEKDIHSQTESFVAIRCWLSSGDQCIIEIQRWSHKRNVDRIFYDVAKSYSGQIINNWEEQIAYDSLNKVVVIVVADFPLFQTSKYISHYKMLDTEDPSQEIDCMQLHFIDLTKFHLKSLDQLKSPLDVWCYFLKSIVKLDTPARSLMKKQHPFIKEAIDTLENYTMSPSELADYLRNKKYFRLSDNDIGLVGLGMGMWLENAMEKFREEEELLMEKEKLLEEEKKTFKKMLAEKLKEQGMSIEQFCCVTGLEKGDLP